MLISRILAVLLGVVAAAVLGAGVGSSIGQGESDINAKVLSAPEAVVSSTTTHVAPTTTAPAPRASTTTTTQAPTTTTTRVVTTTRPRPTTTSTTQTTMTTVSETTTTSTTTQVPTGSSNAPQESQFLALINGLRSAPLLSDSSLRTHARNWARHMAETDKLAHSSIGSLLDPWITVGENVAFGHAVTSMFEALRASSAHRGNMVNESFTHIGIGVWVDAEGRTWTAHVFGG